MEIQNVWKHALQEYVVMHYHQEYPLHWRTVEIAYAKQENLPQNTEQKFSE